MSSERENDASSEGPKAVRVFELTPTGEKASEALRAARTILAEDVDESEVESGEKKSSQ